MEGKKQQSGTSGDDADIYEATAGWDSYVSGLVAEQNRDLKNVSQESQPTPEGQPERRRKPRDRTPVGHRARLITGEAEKASEDQ